MKFIEKKCDSDIKNLLAISKNRLLLSHPHLSGFLRPIVKNYCTYRQAKGNAKSPLAPRKTTLTPVLEKALRQHFAKPPKIIETFIDNLRRRGSPNICPMCGSPKSGTIDHVFPKEDFPELSFFSLNLVPACDCNIKRKTILTGPGPNDRVMHPYFDQILSQRLVRAIITQSEEYGFSRPKIDLEPILQENSEYFDTSVFHINNILRKTDILSYFDCTWTNILRHPEDYIIIRSNPPTLTEFTLAVSSTLDKYDRQFGTPNNWESMLFSGITVNPPSIEYLFQRTLRLRQGLDSAEDI